ncbi:MAG: NAD(P)/FAD-dependent oxidoreductase, partial [Terriglobia bacterium]
MPVKRDALYLLTGFKPRPFQALRIPSLLVPPETKNHGFFVISLAKFCRWLGEKAAQAGVQIFAGFSAVELLIEGERVAGVRTSDMGVGKDGRRKSNYQAGVEIRAKVTVFGEGPKGTLSEKLIDRFHLREEKDRPMYSLGVKEVIELPDNRFEGRVLHTLGYPLSPSEFGGGFLYGMKGPFVSAGLVVGIDWTDPRMDPQLELQRWKSHPFLHGLLRGGKVVEYGSRMIPEGGHFSIPKLYAPGALLVGDAAGLVNIPRLKGIHLAMKSGMLAAETILEALKKNDFSEKRLSDYPTKVEQSFIKKELYRSRNFRQAFQSGLFPGLIRSQLHRLLGGRGIAPQLRFEEPLKRLTPARI